MEKVIIPSSAIIKAHQEYERELALVDKWQNELLTLMTVNLTGAYSKEEWKQFFIDEASDRGLHPLECMMERLNFPYFLNKFYSKFKENC